MCVLKPLDCGKKTTYYSILNHRGDNNTIIIPKKKKDEDFSLYAACLSKCYANSSINTAWESVIDGAL